MLMHLEIMKILPSVILVSSLLVISVHGGQIQENPTTLPYSAGLNKDFTAPAGWFPEGQALQSICTEDGIFPVTGTCNQFYSCEKMTGIGLEWSVNWLTCPEGRVFSVASKKCIPPPPPATLIASRPECQKKEEGKGELHGKQIEAIQEEELHEENFEALSYTDLDKGILKRRKRQAISDSDLVSQSEEICDVIRTVDTYIRHIKSKSPLRLASNNNRDYKNLLMDYNNDLADAQRNCDTWRTPNGIVKKLHSTYALTKAFGQELNAQFEDHQRKILSISNPLQPDILKIEENIKTLKERIQRTKETITEFVAIIDSKSLASLENEVKTNEQELTQLKTDGNRQKILRELEELKTFFQYVKNKAIQIKDDALDAKIKLESFLKDMEQDSSAFNRHTSSAQSLMNTLEKQRMENNNNLDRNQKDVTRLSGQIKSHDSEISKTQRQIDRSRSELNNIDREIREARKEAQTRVKIGAPLLAIPFFGWIAGGALLGTGIRDTKALDRRRERTNNHYQYLINSYNNQLNSLKKSIQFAKDRVSSLKESSRGINSQLSSFGDINRGLQDLKDNVNSIMPFLKNAIEDVGKTQKYFDTVLINLNLFISDADRARTNAEAKNTKRFGYSTINQMMTYWDNASENILDLEKCPSR